MKKTMLCLVAVLAAGTLAAGEFNVMDFGAKADRKTNDTKAIQAAIDACTAAGGGRVLCPSGTYFVAHLDLENNVDLHLAKGCVLMGSLNVDDYKERFCKPKDRIWGVHSILGACGVTNIAVTGEGTVYAQGLRIMYDDSPANGGIHEEHLTIIEGASRAKLLVFEGCENVVAKDFTVKDSASWTLHFSGCRHLLVDGVKILNHQRACNVDGVDPDCCIDMTVRNCYITSGDDGVVVKCMERTAKKFGHGCENIVVSNCTIYSTSAALKVGTETWADVRNVLFTDCEIHDSSHALAVYARDGGRVDGVTFRNIRGNARAFKNTRGQRNGFGWWGKGDFICVTAGPRRLGMPSYDFGSIRNVRFENLDLTAESSVYVVGRAKSPVESVSFRNCRFHLKRQGVVPTGRFDETPSDDTGLELSHTIPGLFFRWTKGVAVEDVTVDWSTDREEAWAGWMEVEDSADVTVAGGKGSVFRKDAPWLSSRRSENVAVNGVKLADSGDTPVVNDGRAVR